MRIGSAWQRVVVLAGMLMSGLAGAVEAPAAVEDIDARIGTAMADAGLVGVGAAVIVDRRVVWSRGFGFADRQRGVLFTPDTTMNIASITKTVTGVAMMQAVQAGKLSLDEDINTYLPFKVVHPQFPGTRITLRQLATHTSGIDDRWSVYQRLYHWGGDSPEALGDFLRGYLVAGGKDYAADNFIPHRPGTYRAYSNIGAGLVGYIVERVMGEPFHAYTKRTILAPLKMTRSHWFLSQQSAAERSTLYASQGGFAIPMPDYGLATYPDGGLRSSVADLSRFFIAVLGDGSHDGARILSPASVAELRRFQYTPGHVPDNVVPAEKNSGLFWATKFDTAYVGHGGSDPGVHTAMLANPSGDVAVVLFVNTSVDDRDGKVYAQLFDALWLHALTFKPSGK